MLLFDPMSLSILMFRGCLLVDGRLSAVEPGLKFDRREICLLGPPHRCRVLVDSAPHQNQVVLELKGDQQGLVGWGLLATPPRVGPAAGGTKYNMFAEMGVQGSKAEDKECVIM